MGLGYGKDRVMFMPSHALIKLLVMSKNLGVGFNAHSDC